MQMISHAYLVNNLPRFLLLNSILLLYVEGDQSIEEKCAFFQDSLQQLQPLKALLNDPKLILSVYCCIDRGDPSQFREHSELLDHIRDDLLPMFSSKPNYMFGISSDENCARCLISSILQMEPIKRCSTVFFWFKLLETGIQNQSQNFIKIPIKTLSEWLHRESDAMEFDGREQRQRHLQILSENISDDQKMYDHLKKVRFSFILWEGSVFNCTKNNVR